MWPTAARSTWPILKRRAIGLLHSGSKGTRLEIARVGVEKMRDAFGSEPGDLVAQLSPCIRPPYYEVNFAAEIVRQLREAGVGKVSDSGANTGADLQRYYSYRMEKGRTGRLLALLMIEPAGGGGVRPTFLLRAKEKMGDVEPPMRRVFDEAEPEMLDVEQPVSPELQQGLEGLQVLNRYFGAYTLVRYFARRWLRRGRTYRVLDLATGSGDIPRMLVRWARRQRVSLQIDAVDLQPSILEIARRASAGFPEIHYIRADARTFSDAMSYDLVCCSLALHHFSEGGCP